MQLKALSFLAIVVGAFSAEYTYDRCDKKTGPAEWGATTGWEPCGTSKSMQAQGTPIDVCGAQSFTGTVPAFSGYQGYDVARTLNASNLKHTIQVYVSGDAPSVSLGGISGIIGRGTNTSTHTWNLAQIHFHWGRAGLTNEGSEHYLQGVAYPMEAHLVHYNARFESLSAAVAAASLGTAPDALLVIGYFMQVGNTDLDFMTVLGGAIGNLKQTSSALPSAVKFSDFFSGSGAYYSYAGSLTTPPCLEVVSWVVMKEVKTIKQSTLDLFKDATTSPAASKKFVPQAEGTYGKFGNFRPLQKRNSRPVYTSDGTTTACTTFTEAYGTCNGAQLFGPSMVFHLVALFVAVGASRM